VLLTLLPVKLQVIDDQDGQVEASPPLYRPRSDISEDYVAVYGCRVVRGVIIWLAHTDARRWQFSQVRWSHAPACSADADATQPRLPSLAVVATRR
jgi:hypothetical protein